MKAYSNDLRKKIIQSYQNKEGSLHGIAQRFSVSPSFVWLLLQRFLGTGLLGPKPHGGGHPSIMTPERLAILRKLVEQQNDATLLELREQFYQKTSVRVSRETIARALRKLRLTRKKKTFHASERENDPSIAAERKVFIQAIPKMHAQHIDIVDECGINLGMAREYARAEKGCRAEAHHPVNQGCNVTLIAALTSHGIIAPFMVPGSLNTDAFKVYVEQVLLPEITPGDTVLLDNLSVHKVQGIADLLASRHAKLKFLPRYSPELSPIELAWSKIKIDLCKSAARSYDELVKAVREAINKVSLRDSQEWFNHCGYCIESD